MTCRDDPGWPEDQHGSSTVKREFRHGPWAGLPPRHIWNAGSGRRGMQTCLGCGYKWDQADFWYRATPDTPPEIHTVCWNCWMLDTQSDRVHQIHYHLDALGRDTSRAAPKSRLPEGLRQLEGGK